MVKIGNKHGCSLDIKRTIRTIVNLLQRVLVETKGGLGRVGNSLGLRTSSSLAVAVQRNTPILCMNSPVMSQEQITTHKCALTLLTFEWPLFRICIKAV